MTMENRPDFDPMEAGDIRGELSRAFGTDEMGVTARRWLEELGEERIKYELLGMADDGIADTALAVADALGWGDLARQFAENVRNHQGYNRKGTRELLEKYPSRTV